MPTLLASQLIGPWDVLGLVVAALAAAVLVVVLLVRHSRRGSPGETLITRLGRRRFFQQSGVALFGAALVGLLTAATDYFVRVDSEAGGKRHLVGHANSLRERISTQHTPFYDAVGGFFVNTYPEADLDRARQVYGKEALEGMEMGFVALDQACPHLGCPVKWCPSSKFFECPCHGSRFNAVGELKRGPSPRGMFIYPLSSTDGQLSVDTSHKIYGAAPGTDTTGQQPSGPHCN